MIESEMEALIEQWNTSIHLFLLFLPAQRLLAIVLPRQS